MATVTSSTGAFYKGVQTFIFGTTTTDGVQAVELTGASFNQSNDLVGVRAGTRVWPRMAGAINKTMEVTVNLKDLESRAALAGVDSLYDVDLIYYGAGLADGYYAKFEAPFAGVGSITGDVDNTAADVEGGSIAFQPMNALTATVGNVPFSWSLWTTSST